jgi:hypothetical protein
MLYYSYVLIFTKMNWAKLWATLKKKTRIWSP